MANSTDSIKYPPEELLHPSFGKRDYQLILLWLLENNDVCTWAGLSRDINKSTLSIYLGRLKAKNFIVKSKYNEYRITQAGKEQFYKLSKETYEDKLNTPPDIILSKRIYDDLILWMVYNNNSCRWADFTASPLAINQSSLSKAIRRLMDKQFIEKNDKMYQITFLGKEQYADVLTKYHLDQQYILELESRRITKLTKKALTFFEQYQITDTNIQFRFLQNILKFPYDRVEQSLSQEDFWKTLLFFAINHPTRHENLISVEDFTKEYDIKKVVLDFILNKIVVDEIYPIKFFPLAKTNEKIAYFHENEKLEEIFGAVVKEYITRFTYLTKLYEDLKEQSPVTMEATINGILADLCASTFDPVFKEGLMLLLPRYVLHLTDKTVKESEGSESLDYKPL